MNRKIIFIPKIYDPLDQDSAPLDGTGRAFEVSIACPDSPRECSKWTLVEFTASKWYADAKPLGGYYTCIGCEFDGQSALILERDYPPTVVCEESQKFGEAKHYEFVGRRCPRCADDKRRENRTRSIPSPREGAA